MLGVAGAAVGVADGGVSEQAAGGDGDAGERVGVGVGGDQTGGVTGGDLTTGAVIPVAGGQEEAVRKGGKPRPCSTVSQANR